LFIDFCLTTFGGVRVIQVQSRIGSGLRDLQSMMSFSFMLLVWPSFTFKLIIWVQAICLGTKLKKKMVKEKKRKEKSAYIHLIKGLCYFEGKKNNMILIFPNVSSFGLRFLLFIYYLLK
jgi:hypothetical protein